MFTCVVSGSFRRHLDVVREVRRELEGLGLKVLSPGEGAPTHSEAGFVFLEGDEPNPAAVERRHLDAIGGCDFLYVVCPDGILGPSTTVEVGFALAHEVPIFFSRMPIDPVFRFFGSVCSDVDRIPEVLRMGAQRGQVAGRSLPRLQQYVRYMADARGFSGETSRDVVLLLVEEVGELAKEVRWLSGLAIEGRAETPDASGAGKELSDCLIYLLELANLLSVDLFEELARNERLNARRMWSSNGVHASS